MYFYEVRVADKTYKGQRALSYHSSHKLPLLSIVSVPIKNKQVLGFVSAIVKKPIFTTKPLEVLPDLPPLPSEILALHDWIQQYYPASAGEVTQLFLPSKIPRELLPVTDAATLSAGSLPALTPEQQRILQQIEKADTYLLHGDTGTGKTRIYLELALRAFAKQKSSIILTPEIGLTPQLTETFEMVFGSENVVLIHSQLTEKARLQSWFKILQSSRPVVVLGPRSALFTPLKDVGLIVLDEVHESSYKQEQAPHYHASKVASKLASLYKATLILGSATPPVTDYFLAEAKQKSILRMKTSATPNSFTAPAISVIDLKDRAKFTKQPHLSDELLASIKKSMHDGEQSLIFLNRRGTARLVMCQKCGWQAACSHCDLPFTYHGDSHTMRCHTCGLVKTALTSCPSCNSADIVMKSIGTKAIVDELSRSFPEAHIQRFDTDNKRSERLEAHYQTVSAGKVDIIVGTQIVAKGLDLPKLSTVGVVIADTSLFLPDYTAQERSYQLLRQVIGRVGRGHRAGNVFVQTYDPQSRLIQDAVNGSWDDFYKQELEERKKFLFPPFCHTLKLTCRRASSKSAQQAAEKVAAELRKSGFRILVDGPMPSYHEKMGSKYQWQLNLKAKNREELLKVIAHLPANWSYDIDPLNLL